MSPIPIGILAASGAGEAGYIARLVFSSTRRPHLSSGITGNGDWVINFNDDSGGTLSGFVKVNAAGNAVLFAKRHPFNGRTAEQGNPIFGALDDFLQTTQGATRRINSSGASTIGWSLPGMVASSGGTGVFTNRVLDSSRQEHLRFDIGSTTSSFYRRTSYGSNTVLVRALQSTINGFVSLFYDNASMTMGAVRYTSAGTLSWGRQLTGTFAYSIGGIMPRNTGASGQTIFLLRGSPTLYIGALNSSGNPTWQVGVNRGTGQAYGAVDAATGITYIVDRDGGANGSFFIVGINSSGTVVNHFEILHNSSSAMVPRGIEFRNGLLYMYAYDDGERNVGTLMKFDPGFRGTVSIGGRTFTFRAPVLTTTSTPTQAAWNSNTFSNTTLTNGSWTGSLFSSPADESVSITNVPV